MQKVDSKGHEQPKKATEPDLRRKSGWANKQGKETITQPQMKALLVIFFFFFFFFDEVISSIAGTK